jgi:4-hydroxy-3-methylbut-2-enyl diphosphate reductase
VPQGAPLIFSAHGVSKLVVNEANEKKAITIDATCPLVTKVHVQAKKFSSQGYHIFLIGHRNHPEVEGTLGQIDSSEITLIENTNDVSLLKTNFEKVAFVTQTTLSVDDTKEIINQLKIKFPKIVSSAKEDICYATTNRQNAIKKYAIGCDKFIVVGSRNSSNSSRLVDVAINAGCSDAVLLDSKDELDLDLYENAKVIGISSGASVPEDLVLDIVEKFKSKYDVEIKNFELQKETVSFNLPKNIRR